MNAVDVDAGAKQSATVPQRKRRRGPQRTRSRREVWLLVLPTLIPVALFSVYPLARGIYLGFTDTESGYNVTSRFNGLHNYQRLLNDSLFWQAFRNGLIWAFSITVVQFILALGLALLLNERLHLRWLARTLALVPWAMPPVIVAIMWRLTYHPDAGILNAVLRKVGLIQQNVDWLGGFSTALIAVIVVGIWAGMPQTTVALLGGLQSVPTELKESAAVDGAGAWRRFRHVVLPHLRPVILAITTLDFVWNFNSFGLIYVLTNGGPGGRTTLPMLFAYNEAFKYGHFGYAAAMGNAMVLIVVAIVAVYLWGRLKEAT